MSRTINTDEHPNVDELTESDRHRLLAAERRRHVLSILSERPTPVALDDLAGAVAARETGRDGAVETRVTDVQISLHHAHLPEMAELGVIDYDARTHRITQ